MLKIMNFLLLLVVCNISYAYNNVVVKDDLKLLKTNFENFDFNKVIKVSKTERCLAETAFEEAGGLKKLDDKFLSAIAALNRARSDSEQFPDTVCGVIAQKAQFPWYKKSKRNKIKEYAAWQTALAISKVLQAHKDQIRSKITFFHTKKIHPKWAKKMKVLYVGEAHIFY